MALRHQLIVLRRKSPKRLAFSNFDRLIFAGLYKIAPNVLNALALPIHRRLRFCMLRPLHDLGACDHPVFFTALRTVTFVNALERKGRMNGAYAPAFTVRAG